jgi:polyhydroxyalkanoate synthase subunit PhaC
MASDPTAPPKETRRQGPRPLPFHLTAAMLAWTSSIAALPLLKSGSLAWKEELREKAAGLAEELERAKPEEFAGAVAAEAAGRMAAFLDGLARYRHHAYRRHPGEVSVLWREGSTRLLDYRAGGEGLPVLVVPSLINRAYILDLAEGRSFMRFLAGQGFRPFLVDWDAPGETERSFSLEDYIAGRLSRALDELRKATGAKPVVLGYCMGGLLALGLACLRERDLSGLALLATPWDFHAERPEQAEMLGALAPAFEPLLESLGELPVDAIQALFASLDPSLALRKFLDFARLDPASERARQFVALEDWLNDGVPMAAEVARECLSDWYGENQTGRGQWRIAGKPIDPTRLALPALAVIPHQDRIVPPGSALALANALPNVQILRPPTGHIGMMAGGKAETEVWRPVASWLSCTAAKSPLHSGLKAQPGKAKRRKP